MTDGTGKYRAKETVPAYGEEVYIYTSYIGVPMLYKTKIVGNTITADINWDTADRGVCSDTCRRRVSDSASGILYFRKLEREGTA